MSTIGGIPPNIEEVLSSDNSFVLVVLGPPGTGKSLFVQEIVRRYESSLMIITSAENYVTTNQNLSQDIKNWDKRHLSLPYWHRMSKELPQDATLTENLKILLEIDSDIPSVDIVIVDSWTDFQEPIDTSKRYAIQQTLIHSARKEKKKLILVTEGTWRDQDSLSLFHSADGVIQLEKIRDNQRMFRQIVIEKMRSHPIGQDSFLFTLYDGRFTYIPWYKHEYPAITVERDPIPDASPEHMSTGNSSLDHLLSGGFEKGRLTLVEVDDLSVPYLETIYIPFLSNHLQQGRPAVILLPEGWSPETFSKSLSQFVDKSHVDEQVVFFGRQALGTHTNTRGIDLDPWKTLQEIRYESGVLERKFNHEVTELFALDTLENMYGATNVRSLMAEISASLSSTQRSTISVLSKEQAIRSESISHHIHLKVQEISGVLSVCGITPRTNYLAVRQILSGGFLDYDLLPIV
ncbi:MAG: ATPase domain-containing protein [Candidatus Thorarchaeota archaeon]